MVANTIRSYLNWIYCIWGIRETAGASSDVYCQSINDNHIWTSCAFYVKSIQGKHSGGIRQKAHKERTRYCRLGREGDNVSGGRERAAWVLNWGQYLVDFDRWSKSAQSIFGYLKWPYQHRDILRQRKQYNRHQGIFRKVFTSNGFSGATTLTGITLKFTINWQE